MDTRTKIIAFITTTITSINSNLEEHKLMEESKFGKNFKVGTELLFESNQGGFYEGYFLGHVRDKASSNVDNYHYKLYNKTTERFELCPIYSISGYVTS